MIRINLLKNAGGEASRPPVRRTLVSRQEAVMGAVLLLAGAGVLLYLATRPVPVPAPAPTAAPQAKAPLRAPETAPASPAPPPAASATPATTQPAEPQGCQVTQVAIRRLPDALVVFVQANASPTFRKFTLDAPDRIVIDLPGCRESLPREHYAQAVEHPVVTRVRASQFQADMLRLVLDVRSIPRYEVRPAPQGLEIHIAEAQP